MRTSLWILIVSLFILLIYTAFFSYPDDIWELLVGSARSGMSFYDLRTLNAVPNAISKGLDPYFFNPTDPSGRLLNYPPIWIYIVEFFGLGNIRNMNILGLLIGVAAISLFLIFVKKSNLSPLFWLFLVSHSFLFALERGNIDLLIFNYDE